MSLCTVFFSWLCFSKSINSFNKGNCAQRSGIERRQTPGLGTLSSAVHVSFQVLWIDAQAPHRGEHCHFVYINQPSGHVEVTGSAKFLIGGSCTAREKKKFDPTRTMQGDRCDLTWLWAERGHHWISTEYLTVLSQEKHTYPLCGWIAPHLCQGITHQGHNAGKQHANMLQHAETEQRITVMCVCNNNMM